MDVRNLEVVKGPSELLWWPWTFKLLISSLALVSFCLALLGRPNHLPFSTRCAGASCEVTAAPANAPEVSLRVGDRVLLGEQPFATRAALIDDNVPRNHDYAVVVQRGAQRLTVAVHTVSRAAGRDFAQRSIITFVFLFGLLMLWRGESAASGGLCLFALGIVLGSGLYARPFAPPWNLIANGLGALSGGPAAFMGLYITADALARVDQDSRTAHRARAAYLGALLLLYLTEVVPVALLVTGRGFPFATAVQVATLVLALVVWIVPLLYLLQGYRAGTPANRLRIRWFIASIALLLPLIGCNLLLQLDQGFSAAETDLLGVAQVLLTVAIFAMLSYAALSQRLVAVRFVLNHALVFGSLTASLIGVLSLLESLIERSVISKEAGLALDIAVPLLLGVSIHRIHRWGEDSVERFVFRNEYRARNAILAFLRDAGFIAHPTTLYERTVEVFGTHAGGRYAAMYLADKSGYERVAAGDHARELPVRIGVDDVAMVRLRATLAPLDLFTLSSSLGATGLALPLVIRGRLEGVLVCGAKAEGRYAQAEIEFLSKAASGIAACVIALRAELHGRFVGRVAEGALSTERIVEEARALVES
ncbi:MAG: GAF domain-containing protein [Steroidobacteraceae bacterium]